MQTTTSIHFVRHGEVDNPSNVRYGRLPGFHLSSNGRKQIEQTANWFIRYPIKAIYASPLERTQQTATLIGQAHPHAPIHLDARLLENKTASEFEGHSRDLPFRYSKLATPEAETTEQIVTRLHSFVEAMCIKHSGEHIIAVSHGDPIGLLYHALVYDERDTPSRVVYPGYGCDWHFIFRGAVLEAVWCTFLHDDGRLRK